MRPLAGWAILCNLEILRFDSFLHPVCHGSCGEPSDFATRPFDPIAMLVLTKRDGVALTMSLLWFVSLLGFAPGAIL